MSFNNKKVNFNVGMNNLISLSEFCAFIGKKGAFVSKLFKFILKEGVDERFVDENGEILSVFYGTSVKITAKNLFIDKRAIQYFIKKYEKDLINFGVSAEMLKSVIYELPRVTAGSESVVNLWEVMAKLSPNTKCVSELCKYVKDNYLDAKYPVTDSKGYIHMEPVFAFSKGKAGRSSIVMKKDAYSSFMKRYKELIKKEAARLDSASTIISLRGVLRELNMTENKDLLLKDFIINNCLDETFTFKNEEGKVETLPCFSYTDERYLSIDKRGLRSFVSRHEAELRKIGFKNFAHVLADKPKLIGRGQLYSLKDVQILLNSPKLLKKITQFLEEKGVDSLKIKLSDEKEYPVFKEFYFKGQKGYYMPKSYLDTFLMQHQDLLESFGTRREFILDRSGIQKIPYKDSQMIVFDDFYQYLTTDGRFHKELSNKIKTLFKDETYECKDEMGLTQKAPVFQTVRSGVGVVTVFKNEQALKSFISNHRYFLIKNGIKKDALEKLLGEKEVINYTDDFVPLYDFPKVFHQSKTNIIKTTREKYLNETYPTYDENGVLLQKPMFVAMQHDGKGMIFYGIKKDMLVHFAKKHQEELKISDLVIKDLTGEIKISTKMPEHLTIADLFKGMGKDSRNTIVKMEDFVVQKCMNDMFVTKNEADTLITKPIFSYRRQKESGSVKVCIDVNGFSTFFKKYRNEMAQMGINLTVFAQRVKESKLSMRHFILNRLKQLGRV